MNENLKDISFFDLLNEGVIRIPAIQRDYAQGRRNSKVDKIRKKFVHSLALVVKGLRDTAKLDFVYGNNRNNAFEPLDGQQRLTTLFLFHWLLGYDLKKNEGENETEKSQSRFIYETRISTTEFCNELVKQDAKSLIKESIEKTELIAKKKIELKEKEEELLKTTDDKDSGKVVLREDMKKRLNAEISNIEKEIKVLTHKRKYEKITPSILLRSRTDSFKYSWKFDPSIKSMLVMIDAIYDEMEFIIKDQEIENYEQYKTNLKHITFNELNLEDFDLSDELFIKMNARGKQLSDFDLTKSTLEEELQLLQKEMSENNNPLATTEDEKNWRSYIDGKWIDLFWHHFAIRYFNEIDNDIKVKKEEKPARKLSVAKRTEKKFKMFLMRMIALQLLEKLPECKVRTAAYNMNDDKIDNILDVYQDSLTEERKKENNVIISKDKVIDFKELILYINSLIYKNGETYNNITDKLSDCADFEPVKENKKSYFDILLKNDVSNDFSATFFGISLFTRYYSFKIDESDNYYESQNCKWLKNLEQWTRLVRNLVKYDNVNSRNDKEILLVDSLHGIKDMFADFKDFINNNNEKQLFEDDMTVVRFIASDKCKDSYKRLDNSVMKEEKIKAELKISENGSKWKEAIDNAEKIDYLWGQIGFLLKWSETDNGYDLEKFKKYTTHVEKIFNLVTSQKLFYVVMLCQTTYKQEKLYEFNKDRDLSFKRYFRNDNHAPMVKYFVDRWIESGKGSLNDYLNEQIDKFKNDNSIDTWKSCMAEYPDMINWSNNKMVFEKDGHIQLAQKRTIFSHCYDPILLYLHYINETIKKEQKEKGKKGNHFKFSDSQVTPYENSVEFIDEDNNNILVKWIANGGYSVTINEKDYKEYNNAKEMLEIVKPLVKNFYD